MTKYLELIEFKSNKRVTFYKKLKIRQTKYNRIFGLEVYIQK